VTRRLHSSCSVSLVRPDPPHKRYGALNLVSGFRWERVWHAATRVGKYKSGAHYEIERVRNENPLARVLELFMFSSLPLDLSLLRFQLALQILVLLLSRLQLITKKRASQKPEWRRRHLLWHCQ